MIKIEDLRIGSIVWDTVANQMFRIDEFTEYGKSITLRDGVMIIRQEKHLDPIPISKDILVNMFGYKQVEDNENILVARDGGYYDSFQCSLCYSLKEKVFIVNSNPYDGHEIPCEYVHQLQDIHKVVLGEDLK